MSTSRNDNQRYLLRLWLPALAISGFVGILLVAALASGDPSRIVPAAFGIAFTALMFVSIRRYQKRRITLMLQTPDPTPFLRSFASSLRRMPNGAHFAAANSATVLALYGRFEEAKRALESASWAGAPPLVQAQESVARAAIAYAYGSITEGLDYAVAATQQASLVRIAPGAARSELAFRTYRNLGLALAGRATDSTCQELRSAFEQLPILGQVAAAWGLAIIAKNNGNETELQAMQAFIKRQAPYCKPVLQSVGAA